jgi:hypothetical protein
VRSVLFISNDLNRKNEGKLFCQIKFGSLSFEFPAEHNPYEYSINWHTYSSDRHTYSFCPFQGIKEYIFAFLNNNSMSHHYTQSYFSRISKSLVIGIVLTLALSLPLHAIPVHLSAKVVQTSLASVRNMSKVSIIGGAYFLVLLGVGYAVSRQSSISKDKEEESQK